MVFGIMVGEKDDNTLMFHSIFNYLKVTEKDGEFSWWTMIVNLVIGMKII